MSLIVITFTLLLLAAAQGNDFCKTRKANQVKNFIDSDEPIRTTIQRDLPLAPQPGKKWRDDRQNVKHAVNNETELEDGKALVDEMRLVYLILATLCFGILALVWYMYGKRAIDMAAQRKERLRKLKEEKEKVDEELEKLDSGQEKIPEGQSDGCKGSIQSISLNECKEKFGDSVNGEKKVIDASLQLDNVSTSNSLVITNDTVISQQRTIEENGGEVIVRQTVSELVESSTLPKSLRKSIRIRTLEATEEALRTGNTVSLKILETAMNIENLAIQHDNHLLERENRSLKSALLTEEIEAVKLEQLNSKVVGILRRYGYVALLAFIGSYLFQICRLNNWETLPSIFILNAQHTPPPPEVKDFIQSVQSFFSNHVPLASFSPSTLVQKVLDACWYVLFCLPLVLPIFGFGSPSWIISGLLLVYSYSFLWASVLRNCMVAFALHAVFNYALTSIEPDYKRKLTHFNFFVKFLILPVVIVALSTFLGVWMADTDPLVTKVEISTVSHFFASFIP